MFTAALSTFGMMGASITVNLFGLPNLVSMCMSIVNERMFIIYTRDVLIHLITLLSPKSQIVTPQISVTPVLSNYFRKQVHYEHASFSTVKITHYVQSIIQNPRCQPKDVHVSESISVDKREDLFEVISEVRQVRL